MGSETVASQDAWLQYRTAAEAFADPATPEHVLLNLPVLDDESWLAFAAVPDPTPAVLERIVHTIGASRLNRLSMIADDIELVITSQPTLSDAQLAELAGRISYLFGTKHVDAVVRAAVQHPANSDPALITLLHPPFRSGEMDWSVSRLSDYNRRAVNDALVELQHPLAAAVEVLRHSDDIDWMGAGHDRIQEEIGKVRAAADALGVPVRDYVTVVLSIAGGSWPGTGEELLRTASAVLRPAD